MTPETEEQIAAFSLWLRRRGCEIKPTKGLWEALRWEQPEGDGHRIAYTNKKGVIASFSSAQAAEDWEMFGDDLVGDVPADVSTLPSAARMRSLLQQFSSRAPFLQADLVWLSQLAVEAKNLLSGEAS